MNNGFEQVCLLTRTALQAEDWRSGLDEVTKILRESFVFDNLAVYLLDPQSGHQEVLYARALGRGKLAEADAAWGGGIASQVIQQSKMVLQEPDPEKAQSDRLGRAYMLGLPLCLPRAVIGALVFVRFGGPPFVDEQFTLACLASTLVASLLERRNWEELSQQMEKLRSQMRLQDDFVSTISHELRTPLGFIKGYSTTLLRQDTSWDDATQREFLTIIDEEADRLTELIENLLESARLESETLVLEFQPVRLDALVRDAVIRAQARHQGMQIELDCRAEIPIMADSVRLAQVFENLFSNADKYAHGSPIQINILQRGDFLRVEFVDHGPGVSPEHLPMIFNRFFRAPGNPGRTGTGLGLFICKQIIIAHHGKIWAESRSGQGTTFFFELPI
jgi:signal transduction histidine kinase